MGGNRAADLGVVLYGLLVLAAPASLGAGYETFTGSPLVGPRRVRSRTADFLVLLFRLLGALNVAAGLAAFLIALIPFRSGARRQSSGIVQTVVGDQTDGQRSVHAAPPRQDLTIGITRSRPDFVA